MSAQAGLVPAAVLDLRRRLGVSQQALSNRLGLSLRAIANYEAGRVPTVRVLIRLARLAGDQGHADLSETFSAPYAQRLQRANEQRRGV